MAGSSVPQLRKPSSGHADSLQSCCWQIDLYTLLTRRYLVLRLTACRTVTSTAPSPSGTTRPQLLSSKTRIHKSVFTDGRSHIEKRFPQGSACRNRPPASLQSTIPRLATTSLTLSYTLQRRQLWRFHDIGVGGAVQGHLVSPCLVLLHVASRSPTRVRVPRHSLPPSCRLPFHGPWLALPPCTMRHVCFAGCK